MTPKIAEVFDKIFNQVSQINGHFLHRSSTRKCHLGLHVDVPAKCVPGIIQ
jgi:hypothetical protein